MAEVEVEYQDVVRPIKKVTLTLTAREAEAVFVALGGVHGDSEEVERVFNSLDKVLEGISWTNPQNFTSEGRLGLYAK